MERRLLEYMARRCNETISREELLSEVWEYAATSNTHTVRTTVNRLRAKIEKDPSNPLILTTVRGKGYQLALDEPPVLEQPAALSPDPTNLPPVAGTVVDRLQLLIKLTEIVGDNGGLVTIHGPGGGGKTTLATTFARSRIGHCAGGVWLCSLQDARTVEDLCDVVHQALRLPQTTADRAEQISEALISGGQTLLILDNFEQLPMECGLLVQGWWRAAPQTQLLITSRHQLAVESEKVLPVGLLTPLEARELYIGRVRELNPDWQLSSKREDALDALLEALDYLPLAIELAAARAAILPPEDLLDRLQSIDGLLATRRHDRPDRQRTLAATLALSWDLLTVHEKNALTQIRVFRGGFRLSNAEQIVCLSPDAPWIGDVIQALHDKSWLKVTETSTGIRFGILNLVHRFIEKQANESQDRADRTALRRRHARHYANLTPDGKSAQPRDVDQRMRLADDVDNLVHGLEAARHHEWVTEAAELALALANLCRGKGASPSQLDQIRAVRAMAGHQPLHQVYLAVEEAVLTAAHGGDPEAAAALLEQAFSLSQDLDDRTAKGVVLREQGILNYHHSEQDVLPYLEEALALHRAEGDLAQQATDLDSIGLILGRFGRNEESKEAIERALELFREAKEPRGEAKARANLSTALQRVGDLDGARAQMEEAAARLRDLGMHLAAAKVTGNLVFIDLNSGDLERAASRTEENLVQNRALRNVTSVVTGLNNLAMITHMRGDLTRASALYQEALEAGRTFRTPRIEASALRQMSKLAHDEGRIEEACEGFEESATRFRALGDVDGELRARVGLADVHLRTRPEVALSHLNRAADLVEHVPSAAAHVWLRLGLISAHAGDMSSARGYLASASEGQIEQLAWLRCHLDLLRAEILHCIGDTTDARALLGEIRAKIEHMKLVPTSQLVVELAHLEDATEEPSPP